MRRRDFIVAFGGAAAMPFAARAQQRATPQRMAMFHPAIPPALLTETGGGSAWRAFFGELRRLGYVEGQNLAIERYWAEGRHDRYADVAREIVASNPDVIVTGTNPVVTVFKAATGAIPISCWIRCRRVWSATSTDPAATSPASRLMLASRSGGSG